jgi:hypothetical protein
LCHQQEEKPVVPQGEQGREYTIAYYKRDTRRGVDWNYADAEGGLGPLGWVWATMSAREQAVRFEV